MQLSLPICTMDCSCLGTFVQGSSQARILEWVAISFSRESSPPRDQTHVSCTAGGFFKKVKSLSCVQLCNPVDCSLPGSSVHGILQERILEWVAISFSRGIFSTQGSNPGLPLCRQTLYPPSHQGSPNNVAEKFLTEPSQRHRWFLIYREFLYLPSGSHLLRILPDFYFCNDRLQHL